MDSVDVSVIIPNYNHAAFLERRIDSVIHQTFTNYEIIILDDCSSDNSRAIIEKYRKEEKVKHIVYNEQNSGNTFSQWKKGLSLAKGKFIWFAESDDYNDSRFLEKMVPVIAGNKNIGLVFCSSFLVNEHDEILQSWTFGKAPDRPEDGYGLYTGRQFFFEHLVHKNVIPNASGVLIRRGQLVGNSVWISEDLKNSGDWKLWLHLSLCADIAYVSETLNYFRKHGSNVTRSNSLLKSEALSFLKNFLPAARSRREKSKIYRSLLTWSFHQAPWIIGSKVNLANMRFYFHNNLSTGSLSAFTRYLIIATAKAAIKSF
ncbi:glycosyltransferase family 2 protein [Flavisolibacter nicotianae]|uniref:glycosyltransferase family 2 protein n=1 Tax=Flavisolibacter nicotianae TaxID=2364882 RepID=UPI001F090949|nr:glycosyltransferase [Flavisolibacter nicotianae]